MISPEFEFATSVQADDLATAIQEHLERFDIGTTGPDVVLALRWSGRPAYRRIEALADGIRRGMAQRLEQGMPLYVILDADIAMNLGAVLREDLRLGNEVLVIDGLTLWDFDYIDLGRLRLPSRTVPVTIKSLVFADTPEGSRREQRVHHRIADNAPPPSPAPDPEIAT